MTAFVVPAVSYPAGGAGPVTGVVTAVQAESVMIAIALALLACALALWAGRDRKLRPRLRLGGRLVHSIRSESDVTRPCGLTRKAA